MKKKSLWLIGICVLLSVAVCIGLFAMGGENEAPTVPTTTPATTTPVTEPTVAETLPQVIEEDEPVIIQVGHIKKHDKGKNGDSGIYFSLDPNELPADTTWRTEYRPTSKSVIKLIRDGETYDIGKTSGGMVIKYSETGYYLKLQEYLLREHYPIRDNDIILVEGIFRNGETMFQIDKSYMLISEGLVFYTTEYPEGMGVTVKQAGHPTSHHKGMTSDGIYFTLENNSIPYNKDWSLAYTPASETNVQLIRGGKTYNIGNKEAETIVKYSETSYYLKMEKWIIKDFYPIRDGDIIVLSGKFVNSGAATVFNISKTYISVVEGLLFFSNEYPTDISVEPVKIPTMQKHPKGLQGTGLFFTAEANSLPYDDWSIEYYPRSASCVKLIRNGETKEIGNVDAAAIVKFSETGYYVKLEPWIYKENYPFVDGDILIFEGKFVNAGMGALMEIGKTYVLISDGMALLSTEYPTATGVEAVKIPTMQKHPKGLQGTGLYFTAEANSLPYDDWSIEYYPRSASCVKLIRNGVTKEIGNVDAAAIVKFNETGYYMKLEQWIYKENYPFVDGDILVVEGKFVNSGMGALMEIGKTYILISDGMALLSTEYPSGSTIEAIKIPQMLPHANGLMGTGLYFTAEANSLPYDNWSIEYYPRSTSCVKLIRNGVTKDIGNVDAAAIVKFNETGYYLKLEQWIYKDNYPFVDGDILVIEGQFVNSGMGALMEIGRTYISISSGMAYLSTEYPTGPVGPTKIMAGTMSSHANGWSAGTAAPWGGLYFKMAVNDAPFSSGWNVRYVPTDTSNVKLIRDGVTYNVANTGAEMLSKFSEDGYYLEFWPISEKPIKAGDILVVEGNFINAANDVVLCIEKTVVTLKADGTAEFSGNAADAVIQAGHMSSHPNGWNAGSNDGLYFTLAANDVPYDGWSVEYEPASVNGLKLVRGGETYNIGIPGRGTIVKFGDTGYYLKLATWTIGEYAPIQPGDVLIVEGAYKNATNGVTFEIARTVITIGEGYALTFKQEANVDTSIQAGAMSQHPNGWNTQSNNGMYFTMASNDVPYSDDWMTYYAPQKAQNVQLIRGGKTYDVAQTDREYIVKYGDTDYYLKLEKWTIGDYYPVVPGDVIVVSGQFSDPLAGVDFTIDTTYITVGEGYTLTFSQEAPEKANHGPMKAHSNGWTAEGGLYFTMEANDVPYDGWNVRYKPASENVVKLVRNGVTYNVAHTGRETITKFSDTGYYYEFWTLDTYKPVLAGDVLIIEGDFVNAANGATLSIAKTTITFNADGTATFESEAGETPEQPEQPEETTNHGPMSAHTSGWTAEGGLYFTMAANDVPYGDWNVRYKPVSESVVKLVRNGATYNVAHTGRETITKYSETEYYYEFWTLDTYKPVLAGDVLIVEGDFVNAANGATLSIAKTTITFNADGTATFVSEGSETPEQPEETANHGPMSAHTSGWTAEGGLYFTMAANDVPFDDWNVRYKPASESVVKLIRNGVTYNVAHTGRETITKYSETEYYYEFWTLDTYKPVLAGDVLIVEGDFVNASNGATLSIAKTTITFNADGTATFVSETGETPENPEQPEDDDTIAVGAMMAEKTGITDSIIYFTLEDNILPTGLTKSDFRPVSADVIKLIRGGKTYEIANPDVKTIIKQTASKYRLLRTALTMELQPGDVLVVDGKFTGGNTGAEVYTIAIEKTYIVIGDGTVSFSTVPPEGQ